MLLSCSKHLILTLYYCILQLHLLTDFPPTEALHPDTQVEERNSLTALSVSGLVKLKILLTSEPIPSFNVIEDNDGINKSAKKAGSTSKDNNNNNNNNYTTTYISSINNKGRVPNHSNNHTNSNTDNRYYITANIKAKRGQINNNKNKTPTYNDGDIVKNSITGTRTRTNTATTKGDTINNTSHTNSSTNPRTTDEDQPQDHNHADHVRCRGRHLLRRQVHGVLHVNRDIQRIPRRLRPGYGCLHGGLTHLSVCRGEHPGLLPLHLFRDVRLRLRTHAHNPLLVRPILLRLRDYYYYYYYHRICRACFYHNLRQRFKASLRVLMHQTHPHGHDSVRRPRLQRQQPSSRSHSFLGVNDFDTKHPLNIPVLSLRQHIACHVLQYLLSFGLTSRSEQLRLLHLLQPHNISDVNHIVLAISTHMLSGAMRINPQIFCHNHSIYIPRLNLPSSVIDNHEDYTRFSSLSTFLRLTTSVLRKTFRHRACTSSETIALFCFCYDIIKGLESAERAMNLVDSLSMCLKSGGLHGRPRDGLRITLKNKRGSQKIRRAAPEDDDLLVEAMKDMQLLDGEAKNEREKNGKTEGMGGGMEGGKGERGQEESRQGHDRMDRGNERGEGDGRLDNDDDDFLSQLEENGEGDKPWRVNTDTESKIVEATKSLKHDEKVLRKRPLKWSGRREMQDNDVMRAIRRHEKDKMKERVGSTMDASAQLDKAHERLYEEYLTALKNLKKQGRGKEFKDDHDESDGESDQEHNRVLQNRKQNKHTQDSFIESKQGAVIEAKKIGRGRDKEHSSSKDKQAKKKRLHHMERARHFHKTQEGNMASHQSPNGDDEGDGNDDDDDDDDDDDGLQMMDKPKMESPTFYKTTTGAHQEKSKLVTQLQQYVNEHADLFEDDDDDMKKTNVSLAGQNNNETVDDSDTRTKIVADIVDAGHDSVTLNVTNSSWKTIIHGRRDVIITGCVIVSIAIVVLVVAIGTRLARWNAESNKIGHLRRRQSYRNLGSDEERWRLRKDDNSNFSLFVGSSDEDEEFESDPS